MKKDIKIYQKDWINFSFQKKTPSLKTCQIRIFKFFILSISYVLFILHVIRTDSKTVSLRVQNNNAVLPLHLVCIRQFLLNRASWRTLQRIHRSQSHVQLSWNLRRQDHEDFLELSGLYLVLQLVKLGKEEVEFPAS